MIYWLTGQPGHGKTVQAKLLLEYLRDSSPAGVQVFHIDGDDLRTLVQNQDYSRAGRENNIRLAQSIAKYLHAKNANVVVSLVAPYRELREEFKTIMATDLVEIYVHTSEIRGREHFHTDYEKPETNFIELCTDAEEPDQTFERLIDLIDSWEGAS
jgi:adenylylsulfate kinase